MVPGVPVRCGEDGILRIVAAQCKLHGFRVGFEKKLLAEFI